MKNNRDYLSESDKEYIHSMLDKINVPRISKGGREFTLFGRIFVLIEKIIENNISYTGWL